MTSKTKNYAALVPTIPAARQGAALGVKPKILTFDIETAPNLALAWGLFNQNISISQIVEPGRVLSFAAKWLGSNRILFHSEKHDGHEGMVRAMWDLLNEADFVVGWNSKGFDEKHMNREFLLAGLTPPAPYKSIDLLLSVRAQFKFASNKLDFVSQQLGIGQKIKHSGQELWNAVLAGDDKAWNLFRRYNKQDVALTEALYVYLLPWLKNHPNMGLWADGERVCAKCGADQLAFDGLATTGTAAYARVQCAGCGSWNRLGAIKGRVQVRAL